MASRQAETTLPWLDEVKCLSHDKFLLDDQVLCDIAAVPARLFATQRKRCNSMKNVDVRLWLKTEATSNDTIRCVHQLAT